LTLLQRERTSPLKKKRSTSPPPHSRLQKTAFLTGDPPSSPTCRGDRVRYLPSQSHQFPSR
jgi:hypothetical protein